MVSKPTIVFGKAERDHAEMVWVFQERELRIRPIIIQYLLLPVLYNITSIKKQRKVWPGLF